jgi:Right handed beta helix region
MAIAATAVWRVRPSSNNLNGAGFDCAIASAATGTHGSFVTATNRFTDTTAAAFTAGMVNRSINIQGVGAFKITAFVDASNITLGSGAPPALSGNAVWSVGAGTDYSQQDAAQVTFNGSTVTATTVGVGATITLLGYTATAADVGNCLQIASGTNFIAGHYFITAQGGTTWTLDRNCTSGAGAAMVGRMGGGWADPQTNLTSALGILVPGNTVYVLGSGIPNPASYTYDYTCASYIQLPNGSAAAGYIKIAGDPATPSFKWAPDTSGGMPVIKYNNGLVYYNSNFSKFAGLYFVASAAGTFGASNGTLDCALYMVAYGCVLDQFSFDVSFGPQQAGDFQIIGCEVFTSVAPGANGSQAALRASQTSSTGNSIILGCNVHDTVGNGIQLGKSAASIETCIVLDCIVAKCRGVGITLDGNASQTAPEFILMIKNCTIDGNLGHGIEFVQQTHIPRSHVSNNIISNQTQASKVGLKVDSGTAAANDVAFGFCDFNVYYNNTSDVSGIDYGPHDTYGGSNPYVGQATENYTLA